jgi:c-di-GMP-binding flagellar brake protein YcgR
LSEGGIGIRLKKATPKLQKNIRINSLKLMLRENKTLHLSGILRYVRTEKENSDPLFRIGIEFDPLKEDDKHTLLDFIDEISNADTD